MHKLEIAPWFLNRARQSRNGRLNAYATLDPPATALLVVDMQEYFVADGMPSCVVAARTIVPNVNRLAQAARAAGATVVWIQTEAPPDPHDWANRKEATSPERWAARRKLLARGGAGFGIHGDCEVASGDKFALKTRYSAFIPHPSAFDTMLRQNSIDTLLIAGVATSTCCESTARDAAMWGYRTVMVADANADNTDVLHNHTLGKFLAAFGDVRTTDELIEMLAGTNRAAGAAAE